MSDRCRSCGAPIEWAHTPKGSRIPLDPGRHDDGNLDVADDGLATQTAIRPARRTHFASCPNAAQHRRKGRR